MIHKKIQSNLSYCFISCPYLDNFCIQQSDVLLFSENHLKLYFDAKHLEKGLSRGW